LIGPEETTELPASWLDEAICQVLKVPGGFPLRDGVQLLAVQLLRSIEADSLPAPAIYATTRGTIRITWERGSRVLLLSVKGIDRFRCCRIDGCITLPIRTIRRNRVEEMRGLVAWIAPSVNRIFVNVYLLESKL